MNDLIRKRNMNEKKSVIIPVKNETKKSATMVYDDYGTVRCVGQVLRVWKNNEAFTDADCIPEKSWLENLVKEFDNDVGAKGGMSLVLM